MGLFEKVFGTHSEHEVKRIMPIVRKIEAMQPDMQKLSDEELRILSEVMDLKKVEEDYSSYNYDEVKKLFNYSATEQQISAYKRLWLRLFIRYPFSGIKALLGTAGGFFCRLGTPRGEIAVIDLMPQKHD